MGEQVQTRQAKDALNKASGGFSKWFGNLLGRLRFPKTPFGNEKEKVQETTAKPVQNDSLEKEISREDLRTIQGIRGIFSKFKPFTPKREKAPDKTLSSDKGLVKKGLLKKLLIVSGFLVFLLVTLNVTLKFIQLVRKNAGKPGQGQEITPTSTPMSFQIYKPSVYAGDPKILKLEEDINILDREISSAIIKDDTLRPPALDFEIKF